MNVNCFSTQAGKSYYYNTISLFLKDNSKSILGELTKQSVNHGFDVEREQYDAWQNQIDELQEKLYKSQCSGDIIFEYDIVRLGKRIDVVLLIKHMVFSLEFKNGAKAYLARDAEQAEDYALNLKNFHKESENLYVCPILVATNAPAKANVISNYPDKQVSLQYANKNNLMDCIKNVYEQYGEDKTIDFEAWYNSNYFPTPTIIEATIEAYSKHTVEAIAHSEAGQSDINDCEEEIRKIVEYAKNNHKKCICFVTGVPGAGKTLVGLDTAARFLNAEENLRSVYLSGNGPLVEVLRKSLINDAYARIKKMKKSEKTKSDKESKKEIEAAMNSFIQDAYQFRKAAILSNGKTPAENVIIFDEAQRCWNKEKLSDWVKKKMNEKIECSEPSYFIDIMDRREDWAVIICLVGLGQDIYDGEVGVSEWFRAALKDFNDWELYYSDKIESQIITNGEFDLSDPRCKRYSKLHLLTSVRSFRSSKHSQLIEAILNNNPDEAKLLYKDVLKNFPLYITRDIRVAKNWARGKVRGSQRCGVIASSSAQRLKAEGIFVPKDIDVANWFLAPKEDLRSSNTMEVVASEFKVQGLEVDYSVVCWDADLRRKNNGWDYYNFSGTSWKKRNKEEQRRYLLNAYRVLLTRARQGMVIFIPEGTDKEIDKTRDKEYYQAIFDYLHNECGIELLQE